MIQSRVQFGARGASLDPGRGVFMDIGFAVFFTILGRDSLGQLTGAHPPALRGRARGRRRAGGHLRLPLHPPGAAGAVDPGAHRLRRTHRRRDRGDARSGACSATEVVRRHRILAAVRHLCQLPDHRGSARVQLHPLPARNGSPGRSPFAVVFAGSALAAIWLEFLGARWRRPAPARTSSAALSRLGAAFIPGAGTALEMLTFVSMFGIVGVCLYEAMLSGLSFVDAFRAGAHVGAAAGGVAARGRGGGVRVGGRAAGGLPRPTTTASSCSCSTSWCRGRR